MIQKIEIEQIPGRKCNHNNSVQSEVLEFHRSDWSACEVSTSHYKTSHSAFAAYKNAITRLNIGVAVLEREGRLFLVRK